MTNKSRLHGGNVRSGGNGKNAGKNAGQPHHTTPAAVGQPVYAANGHVIGRVEGDAFRKNARGSVHMLRAPRGWALDADAPERLRAMGVLHVKITDTETGTVYIATLDTFERYAVPFNRGFGPQVVLPLGYWRVNGRPPRLGQPEPDPDAPRQLSLFEVGA